MCPSQMKFFLWKVRVCISYFPKYKEDFDNLLKHYYSNFLNVRQHFNISRKILICKYIIKRRYILFTIKLSIQPQDYLGKNPSIYKFIASFNNWPKSCLPILQALASSLLDFLEREISYRGTPYCYSTVQLLKSYLQVENTTPTLVLYYLGIEVLPVGRDYYNYFSTLLPRY